MSHTRKALEALAILSILTAGFFAVYVGAAFISDTSSTAFAIVGEPGDCISFPCLREDVVSIDGGYTSNASAYPIPVPPPVSAPTCSLNLTKNQIAWSTSGAYQVLIQPLTNSPQIPGLGTGNASVLVPHTEGELFTNSFIKLDMLVNGGVSFTETTFKGRTLAADQVTMNRVCYVLHGTGAVAKNIGARGYDSCSNNYNLQYVNGAWKQVSGCTGAHLSGSFSCSVPSSIQTYPFSGSHNFNPALGEGTHTYRLTANGDGGTKTCDATVTVSAPSQFSCTLTANPSTINQGQSSQLSWSSVGAETCAGQNFPTGDATSGSTVVSPYTSTNYVMNCSRTVVPSTTATWQLQETDYSDLQYNVTGLTNETCPINSSPNATWVYSAVPTCSTANPEGQSCSTTGSICKRNVNTEFSGCIIQTNIYKCAAGGTTSTIQSGSTGGQTETVQCQTTVTVVPKPNAPSCTLVAEPDTIAEGGQTKLKWTSHNATSISIDNGVGSVSPVAAGSKYVSPGHSKTYTATVTGPGGTATCSAAVTVQPTPPPTCEIKVTPGMCTTDNNAVVLEWTTVNATAFSINNGIGSVYPVAHGTKNINPTQTTEYVGLATGPGGAAECSTTVVVIPPPKPKVPSCALTSSGDVITEGKSVTISWISSNVSSGTISGGVGSASPVGSGSKTVKPTQTTTYVGEFTGQYGSVTCEKKVKVVPPNPEPKECKLQISKSASTDTVQAGGYVEYTIEFKNVGDGVCTGGGVKVIDVVDPGLEFKSEYSSSNVDGGYGGDPVYKSSTRTLSWNAYDLVPGEEGWVKWKAKANTPSSCKVVVPNVAKITAKELNNFKTWIESNLVEVTVKKDCQVKQPACSLAVANSVITEGESTTLLWTSSNVTSGTIDNGVGAATPVSSGSRAVSPTETTLYKGIFAGPYGSVECTAKVKVKPKQHDAPTCTLTTDKSVITPNEPVTFEWTSQNATVASWQPGGAAATLQGTFINTSITSTETFALKFTGPGGTVICSAEVKVKPVVITPACSLSLSQSNINPGESVVLSWTSSNVSSGIANGNVGNLSPVSAGSIEVFPSDDIKYIATFTGPHGDVQCEAVVDITTTTGCQPGSCPGGLNQPSTVLFQKPGEQPLAFVYLSQIPYTGFEAGPALTLIFWLAVALIAALGSYFIMGIGGFRYLLGYVVGFAGVPVDRTVRDEEYEERERERAEVYGAPYPAVDVKPEESVARSVVVPQLSSPVISSSYALPQAIAPKAEDGIPTLTDVIESRAHAAGVLISPEAVQRAAELSADRVETLQIFGDILNEAVRTIPREDGWVMLTSDRFENLAGAHVMESPRAVEFTLPQSPSVKPQTAGEAAATTFAGAILSGDRDAAFSIIRSMEHDSVSPTALMTATASVLDKLYRTRRGGQNGIDQELAGKAEQVSDEALHRLVEVMTHSLDPLYSNPFTGVKLALAQAFEAVG